MTREPRFFFRIVLSICVTLVIFYRTRACENYQLRKKKKMTHARVSAIFLSRNLVARDEEQNKVTSRVIVQRAIKRLGAHISHISREFTAERNN